MINRLCRKCNNIQPITEFYKNPACKDGWANKCKTCIKARDFETKDQRAANGKRWKKENPEKAKASAKKTAQKHKEKWNAWHAEWWKSHPEKKRAKDARLYLKHRDKKLAGSSAWQKRNPDKCSEYRHRRRALLNGAEGNHSKAEANAVLASQNHLCANPHCQADLKVVKKNKDHIIALSRGGTNNIENIQWLCATCNRSKWAFDFDEWLNRQRVKKATFECSLSI